MTGWKGIRSDVLAEAELERDGDLVTLPYRDADGRELYRKCFAPSGRSWYRPKGIKLSPFGLETLPPQGSRYPRYVALLLCEGESDALAVRDVLRHLEDGRAVEYLALALPGASSWRDEWRSLVESFPLVYVCGDGDEPGRRMNRRVRTSVPWARPVWLPKGSDVRALLQADPDGLAPYLEHADTDARLSAALALSPDLDTCRRLLAGRKDTP